MVQSYLCITTNPPLYTYTCLFTLGIHISLAHNLLSLDKLLSLFIETSLTFFEFQSVDIMFICELKLKNEKESIRKVNRCRYNILGFYTKLF